jgi:hypothetical protein
VEEWDEFQSQQQSALCCLHIDGKMTLKQQDLSSRMISTNIISSSILWYCHQSYEERKKNYEVIACNPDEQDKQKRVPDHVIPLMMCLWQQRDAPSLP